MPKRRIYKRYKTRKKGGQRYWVGRKRNLASIPLNEARKLTFYHGTTKERAKGILEEGLDPSKSESGYVWITPNKPEAVTSAIFGPREEIDDKWWDKNYPNITEKDLPGHGKEAILKITIPTGKYKELGFLGDPTKSIREEEFAETAHTIPAEYIKQVDFAKFKKKAMSQYKPKKWLESSAKSAEHISARKHKIPERVINAVFRKVILP